MLAIGFDSGGTRTSYAITRGDGVFESNGAEAGSSISDARDALAIQLAVDWIVDVIEEHDDEEISVWIGAAGFSGATASAIRGFFSHRIAKLAEECDRRNRSVDILIANDGVSLLKAPPLNGSGIVAIVGTGSVVMGTHNLCDEGVIKRGGNDWVVSDEGSGVWMTITAIRLIMKDIQTLGPRDYHSALLDRLGDYFGITAQSLADIPSSHRQLAKAEAVARKMAESRPDLKRYFARFVYPHLFDLCSLETGKPHDPIAAEVLQRSVSIMVDAIREVSEAVSIYTNDQPNLREKLPLVIGGSVAANPLYDQRLRVLTSSECRYVSSVSILGDGAKTMASLAWQYATASDRERRQLARSLDPLHPVAKLL